eukprot:11687860-Alexandrium_andersonii.AAC.1
MVAFAAFGMAGARTTKSRTRHATCIQCPSPGCPEFQPTRKRCDADRNQWWRRPWGPGTNSVCQTITMTTHDVYNLRPELQGLSPERPGWSTTPTAKGDG